MALINTSLPNLIQGVSQQPDTMRFDGQCDEQINALSSVSDGLKKRPNTRYVKNLVSTAIADGAFVHFINRDKEENYVVIINNNTIQAFNLDVGTPTIDPDGGDPATSSPVAIGVSDYLYLASPKKPVDYIKALTVGDNTFLLNTDKSVARKTATADKSSTFSHADNNKAIVFVKQGHYQTDYTVELDFTISSVAKTSKATYISGEPESTGISLNARAGRIASVLRAKSVSAVQEHDPTPGSAPFDNGFGITEVATTTAANTGEVVQIEGSQTFGDGEASGANYGYPAFTISRASDTQEFKIRVSDSKSGTALGVAYKEVDSISDLPKSAPDGFKIKVRGDADSNEDDYYVKFETNDGDTDFSDGGWVEDVGFDDFISLDETTLPQKLVSTAANTFTLGACTWTTKQVGDDDTNPFPSFLSKNISNLFFYKNRLGFLSEGSIILSEAGEYFNFFRTTVRSLLDSDPIDVDVASTKVTKLKSAVGFQENLILFGERGQFVLKGGDLLTPKTVSVTPITNYETDTSTTPLELGSYIYFPFSRGSYSGIREFAVNSNTDTFDSAEITAHVPMYIPSGIFDVAGSTSENVICLVSNNATGDNNNIYIYKYYWSGDQKVLSSWSKFTFPFEIRGIEFVESDLYIVAAKNDKTELLVLPMEEKLTDTDAGFNTYLDLRESATVSGTSIALSFTPEVTDTVQVYTREDGSTKAGALLPCTVAGSTVTVDISHDTTPVWVGIKYEMSYTFSEQLFKQRSRQTSTSPSGIARHFLKGGSIFFADTSSFKVEVTPKARNTYTNVFTSNIVGSTTVGTLPIESGAFSFPIMSAAKDTQIKIVNDSALPANFQSAEFESFIHSRSKRV